MSLFPRRLPILAILASISLAAAGFAWEFSRFGSSPAATRQRLENDVRRRFAERTRQVEWLAQQVAARSTAVAEAAASRDPSSRLFTTLIELAGLARPYGAGSLSATVYVLAGPGAYRVLAWSDGPAEDVPAERLSGSQQLFIAQGPLGPRLVSVKPIEREGRRIGMAAAEAVLSPPTRVGLDDYLFETSFGPVSISQWYGGAADPAPGEDRFFVSGADGPLLEVQFSSADLAEQRQAFRRRELVVAALPLVLALLLSSAPLLDRRRGARDGREFDRWSLVTAATVLLSAVILTALASYVGAPLALIEGILGLSAVALAYLFPVSWWWRRDQRLFPGRARARFVAEQLLGGIALGSALLAASWIAATRMPETALNRWHSSLFPLDGGSLLTLCAIRLTELAIGWTAAALLAWLASRWRLSWRHAGLGLAATALWMIAPALVILLRGPWPPVPLTAALPVAAAATFALLGLSLRKYYRHTTQAMRLVLVFGAMVLPSIALYPISAFHAERQARHLIESTYAPAVVQHPSALQEQMARAQAEIDRLPNLLTLVSTPPPAGLTVQSQAAFLVWSQTNLSRARATSEIELYGPDTDLVSRFALNVPEYQSPVSIESWQGASCTWEVYSEVKRFGADDRLMWHARRSVCDASGRFLGGVVIHVLPDYRSLPFIASASPYREVLASDDDDSTLADVPELAVVVYGWGRSPVFTSSDVAWSVTEDLAAQMQASREPFWRDLSADGREYHVYFTNDRAFIYALGYPSPTWFEHATRIAEIAVVIACVFILILLGAMAYAPLTRQHEAPLRVLFREIRTSFYRKLFLFFVLAAIGPVLLLAIAFSAYVSARLQADVKSEAASIVTVARRVFEEISAAQHPDQPQAPPSDDEMVWIRQVIDQDVNIFQGPALIATSQRDLFDSGLLQTRTPAKVYRTIVLDRLPSVVDDDRLGAFQYVVAAAPVPANGRDIVLSVPLAQRQRDIERELDVLNRGMLVASVVVVLFAAGLGASVAGRVSDPVARLTRATRQIAAGRLDVRIVADTADELKRLVDDFNTMTETLVAQRGELARTNQIKAWAEMARQVAHEIKNPLTPVQLATEHLQRVHEDQGRPLGAVFDQCVATIIRQVRLLRQIASEFSNFAGQPTPRFEAVPLSALVHEIVEAYGATPRLNVQMQMPGDLPAVRADRTLLARAITNIVENAVQAMPGGGRLEISAASHGDSVELVVKDSGVGMDQAAAERAFEPYFSTKTAGSGLGLPNAKRNIELCGGTITLASAPGSGTMVTITLSASPRATSAG